MTPPCGFGTEIGAFAVSSWSSASRAVTGAYAEATAVAAIHHVTPIIEGAATVEAVRTALDGAQLAHLGTHGTIHPRNPLFSALVLADGPLTVYDLERLDQAPRLVVLAACDSGRSATPPGDELIGLSATLLALGATNVIASVAPIPDGETAPLMIEFHQRLAAGESAASALALAQEHLYREYADPAHHPESAAILAAAAGFISIGADTALPSATDTALPSDVWPTPGQSGCEAPAGRAGQGPG